MIWQNPWAWTGLAFLALPVLIHLLGRGHAPRRVFPSLRFLPPSRSLPTRRKRVRDPLLLALRLGILSAAVFALTQPLLVTGKRLRDSARGIARVIIVDTSASMRRASRDGSPALAAVRRDAQRTAGEAQTSIVMETATPRRALAGAVAWLSRQHRRAELVIVSDFQAGTIEARDLMTVPRDIGIVLSRVDVAPATVEVATQAGDVDHVARVTASGTSTDVEWSTRTAAVDGVRPNVVILAGPNERGGADAAQRAASTLGFRPPFDSAHAVAVVLPGFERRSELLKSATPLHAPWMVGVVARLRVDSMLIAAAAASMARAAAISSQDSGRTLVVVRADSGRPAVVAAEGSIDGRNRLLLFTFDASSLTTAALVAATTRALSTAAPVTEMDPSTVADDMLRLWQREPASRVAPADTGAGASDGRWFWMIALVLLALEGWVRRARKEQSVLQVLHDRAA